MIIDNKLIKISQIEIWFFFFVHNICLPKGKKNQKCRLQHKILAILSLNKQHTTALQVITYYYL